jgi:GNAT superfamily N-acetyltransferase
MSTRVLRSDASNLIETTLNEYRTLLGQIPGGALYDSNELKWAWTGLSHMNIVFGARLKSSDLSESIKQLQTYFGQRHIVYVNWLISPLSLPSDLDTQLVQYYGAHPIDGQASVHLNGMVLDLEHLVDVAPPEGDMTIEVVQKSSDLNAWLDLTLDHPVRREVICRLIQTFGLISEPHIYAYLCRFQGKAVGAALIFEGAQAVALRHVYVQESLRGRGIGRWISWYALTASRERHHSMAITDATPSGASVYRALGFNECCALYEYAVRIPEYDG